MAFFKQTLDFLRQNDLLRTLPNKTHQAISFSSNDYLGLSQNIDLLEKNKESLTKHGFGSTGSRLLTGNHDLFENLERKLSALLNSESALIFNSGFQANLGTISAVMNKGDVIFADKFCHASLLAGAKQSNAKLFRFKHNNLNDLKRLLTQFRHQFNKALIVTESIFSMDGDYPDIDELIELKKQFNCYLYIDEAHAFGLFDNGQGLVGKRIRDVDFLAATFGKALGSYGAFIACSDEIKLFLINKAITFIYSTALPLPVINFNSLALDLLPQLNDERKKLFNLSSFFRENLLAKNFSVKGNSQIIPVCFSTLTETLNQAKKLEQEKLIALPIRPPTVPHNETRLRFSICATHKKQDLEKVIRVLSN